MKTHKECLEEFREIAEAESKNRERWLEDLRFGFSDDQWPDQLRRARQNNPHGARPCLTVNKIPAHARQILNDMRQARAAIRVLPVDDKADVETAEIIQGIIRHIEHVSNADQAYTIAAEYQVMMGVGYFRINTEYTDPIYNEQEIRIQAIRNPFGVYMDPWCIDITGGDAKSCYVATQFPKAEYERRWPKASQANLDKMGPTSASDWFTTNGIRVAEYFWVEEYEDTYVLVNGVAYPADKYDPSLGPVQREAKAPRKRVKWTLMNGVDFLEDETDKPGEYIPIVRVVGEDYDIDGERFVHGIVRRARDAQQMYNFTVSAIAERNALEPKAPWLIADEAVEGHEDEFGAANRENLPFLRYNAFDESGNAIPAPQRQFPVGANSALINQMASSDADIQATIGQFAASLGEVSNEKSGAAIRQRQQVGDIATFHYPDNLSRAIRQAGKVIISIIPEVYDTPRVARILGEDGEVEQARLDPSIKDAVEERGEIGKIYNLGVGKYDIAVTTGPSYATKRQEGAERMQQYLQGNPALWGVIGDLAVKMDDGPYSEEMAKRIRATIPPEIRQDEEEQQLPPEAMQAIQEREQALQEQGAQMDGLAQENQQMKQAIDGKLIEQQMRQEEQAFRREEMAHEAQMAELEAQVKMQELQVKQVEAQAKLQLQAEKQANETMIAQSSMEAQQASSAETNAILLELARATQMQGEMLAAMLQEMAKPKQLAVQTDINGNIVGGISQTIQ